MFDFCGCIRSATILAADQENCGPWEQRVQDTCMHAHKIKSHNEMSVNVRAVILFASAKNLDCTLGMRT